MQFPIPKFLLAFQPYIIYCACVSTEAVLLDKAVECSDDPESSAEVDEKEDGRESESSEREDQKQGCSSHTAELEAVHGGEETI